MTNLDLAIHVRVDAETRQLLEAEAKLRGLKLADIVREAVREHTTGMGQGDTGPTYVRRVGQ